ncbi:terminase large subunit [Tellurirhabdus bombi]|uniref:terminase large subunit n=1 Tax=Tellurirhabdus bombi TaxID=2907205 RepID=UPI001F187274|nr:terminase large subunit [Tellurirhabdus bombi]
MVSPLSEIQIAESKLAERAYARRNFRNFVPVVRPGYDMRWFHRVIADELQKVYERKTRKLMIFVPPQHGKSELSTRSFPAWVLGKNPNEKIAIVSYAAGIASKFNRDIKRRMEISAYRNLFPKTRLSDGRDGYTKNNLEFEIVGADGYGYSVGVEGALTSKTVDMGIIDDPVKDRQDAQSLTIRENTWDFYTDVFETRLHNESVQVLIQTRWHDDDLSGRLLVRDGIYSEYNPTGWRVVSFPALRTEDQNDFDPRPVGVALWPERHSQEKIEKIKKDSPVTFNALYQQDPKPSLDALVYPNWLQCEAFPKYCNRVVYGLDFGFTNDPTALVRVGVDRKACYLEELIYQTGLTTSKLAELMKAIGIKPYDLIIADSEEPKTIAELQQLGFTVLPAIKGPGSLNAGINKMNEYQVWYTAASSHIAKESKRYQWVMVGNKPTNIPVEGHDHALDAARYAVYTLFKQDSFGEIEVY